MDNNIGTPSSSLSKENLNKFLLEQLVVVREIKKHKKHWEDINILRQKYGFPSVNTDSLRRSYRMLMEYDKANWVKIPNLDKESNQFASSVETNFATGNTVSDKLIKLDEKDLINPEAILLSHGFNPEDFELISAKNSKWQSPVKGELDSRTLYSSKISVKPKNIQDKMLMEILDYFKDYHTNMQLSLPRNNKNSDEVLVLPLYDFHWGRLPDISIMEDFSLNKVKEILLNNITTYIKKFEKRHFKTVYLIVGQDYFNSSFTGYTASQRHLQDNAVDVRTMYTTGTELLIDIINNFTKICNDVKVIGSIGNHATYEEIWLFNLLKAYYRNIPNIFVDDTPQVRKYLDLGASCVGIGHLDKEKDKAFGLMQCEEPKLWASSKTHMFIAGHLHHLSVESKQGVEIWRVPSPTMPDKWTVEQGYVQNIPRTMAFVFDLKLGMIENHYVNI